jgi:hypothetical protein
MHWQVRDFNVAQDSRWACSIPALSRASSSTWIRRINRDVRGVVFRTPILQHCNLHAVLSNTDTKTPSEIEQGCDPPAHVLEHPSMMLHVSTKSLYVLTRRQKISYFFQNSCCQDVMRMLINARKQRIGMLKAWVVVLEKHRKRWTQDSAI